MLIRLSHLRWRVSIGDGKQHIGKFEKETVFISVYIANKKDSDKGVDSLPYEQEVQLLIDHPRVLS